jgi:hypothetical protein
LAAFGSAGELAVRAAVFLAGAVLATVAVICSVADAPTASTPTLHIPEPATYVPWLGLAETKVRPAGRLSVT